jgi:hypothetical protein
VESGLYLAGGVSLLCMTVLFVMGNVYARIALALLAIVLVGGYGLFLAYASGLLAYLVERL